MMEITHLEFMDGSECTVKMNVSDPSQLLAELENMAFAHRKKIVSWKGYIPYLQIRFVAGENGWVEGRGVKLNLPSQCQARIDLEYDEFRFTLICDEGKSYVRLWWDGVNIPSPLHPPVEVPVDEE